MEMISVQGWVLGGNDYDTSSASRANSPGWTKQTQDWFFHSAKNDEHENHCASYWWCICVQSEQQEYVEYSGITEVKESTYSYEHLKTFHGGL